MHTWTVTHLSLSCCRRALIVADVDTLACMLCKVVGTSLPSFMLHARHSICKHVKFCQQRTQ